MKWPGGTGVSGNSYFHSNNISIVSVSCTPRTFIFWLHVISRRFCCWCRFIVCLVNLILDIYYCIHMLTVNWIFLGFLEDQCTYYLNIWKSRGFSLFKWCSFCACVFHKCCMPISVGRCFIRVECLFLCVVVAYVLHVCRDTYHSRKDNCHESRAVGVMNFGLTWSVTRII